MDDWKELEQRFAALELDRRPVAVTFLDQEPAGVAAFEGSEPSGCSFWRLAAAGRTFYTRPTDHFNCAVGSYTHSITLPPERAKELGDTLGMMMAAGYVREEEIPRIPRLPRTPEAIVYAPLADTPVAPDVVLFTCRPRAAMLLQEAAGRAGVAAQFPILGRPTCMALPAALVAGGAVLSLGCIGNRVYTGAGDDQLYIAIPGARLAKVAAELDTIISANQVLSEYAAGRKAALSTE